MIMDRLQGEDERRSAVTVCGEQGIYLQTHEGKVHAKQTAQQGEVLKWREKHMNKRYVQKMMFFL